MLVYKLVELFDISFIGSFGLFGNLSASVSVCGDVVTHFFAFHCQWHLGIMIGDKINSLVLCR